MLTPVYQDWSGRGGGGQVRGSDPKGVNVTAVGLDIRLMLFFQGGGKNQEQIQNLKLGGGGTWVKNVSSLASCQQLTSQKRSIT